MYRHVLITLLLILATLAVFLQVRSFDFINYDDLDYVVDNSNVRGGLTSESIRWAFTAQQSGTWQPLTWLSFLADVRGGQISPGRFHVTNLALHLLNVLLLYALLVVMTRATWSSALVAALFAVHPLHVESVAWVAARKDVLSTFWGLLSLLAYVRFARTRSRIYLAAAALALALGLMAKPMLVTWPFVMLLLDWWPLRRLDGNREASIPAGSLSSLLIEKIPFFALAVASSWITFRVQSAVTALTDINTIGLRDRLANACVSYVHYLGKTFLPQDFSVIYQHPNMLGGTPLTGGTIMGSGLILLVITALIVVMRQRRFLATGWLWFLGTLVPVIGLVQVGTQAFADRFTYVPLIGIFVIVAWLMKSFHENLAARNRPTRWLVPIVGVAVVLAVLWPSRTLTAKWRDSITLYEYSLKTESGSPKLHYNLGLAYSNADRHAEAVEQYRRALRLKPEHKRAWNNLGHTLGLLGDFEESEKAFLEALRLRPGLVLARINYAVVLEKAGRSEEAISQRVLALAQDPDDHINCNHIGVLLAQKGRFAAAIPYFEGALQLKPDWRMAAKNLQNAGIGLERNSGQK